MPSRLRLAVLIPLIGPLLTGLAACGGGPHPTAATTTPPAASRQVEAEPAAEAEVAAAPLAVPRPPAEGPARLNGLTATQVRSLLGQPVFRRRDAPAEIWQYRGRACMLDLFLYDEGAGQRVAYWAVRSPNGISDGECFDELSGDSRAIPSS